MQKRKMSELKRKSEKNDPTQPLTDFAVCLEISIAGKERANGIEMERMKQLLIWLDVHKYIVSPSWLMAMDCMHAGPWPKSMTTKHGRKLRLDLNISKSPTVRR